MSTHFTAVMEGGLLRPKIPLTLKEGDEVEVLILLKMDEQGPQTAKEIMEALAAVPMEEGGKEFMGRDHDDILYGNTKKP